MSDPNVNSFMGVARLDDNGEMVCFCYEADVKDNRCDCKKQYDLPEVRITIEPIPGTRPSEQVPISSEVKEVKTAERQLKRLARESNEIKKGLQNLEKAAKGIRFRV